MAFVFSKAIEKLRKGLYMIEPISAIKYEGLKKRCEKLGLELSVNIKDFIIKEKGSEKIIIGASDLDLLESFIDGFEEGRKLRDEYDAVQEMRRANKDKE